MNSNHKNWMILGLSMALTATTAAAYLVNNAVAEPHTASLLRATAHVALVLFLLVLIARPLASLRPSRFSRTLLTNRRYLGLTLAGVMSAHLALIVLHWGYILDRSVPTKALLIGGGAYLMMYAMVLTSFDRPAAMLGPRKWHILHKTGLYWLGFVFVYTLLPDAYENPLDPRYFALTVLTLVAIAIRALAFVRSVQV